MASSPSSSPTTKPSSPAPSISTTSQPPTATTTTTTPTPSSSSSTPPPTSQTPSSSSSSSSSTPPPTSQQGTTPSDPPPPSLSSSSPPPSPSLTPPPQPNAPPPITPSLPPPTPTLPPPIPTPTPTFSPPPIPPTSPPPAPAVSASSPPPPVSASPPSLPTPAATPPVVPVSPPPPAAPTSTPVTTSPPPQASPVRPVVHSPDKPGVPPRTPSPSGPIFASPPSGSTGTDSPSPPSVPSNTSASPVALPAPATAVDPGDRSTPGNQKSNKSTSSGGTGGSGGGGLNPGATVAIVVAVSLVVLSLLGAAVWYTRKRKRPLYGYHAGFVMPSPGSSPQTSGESANQRSPFAPPLSGYNNYSIGSPAAHAYKGSNMSDISMGNSRFFTFGELYDFTNGFSQKNLLGEGGFGSVYKGCLTDGREVAVKQLKDGSGQGEREFQAEVEIISRVHHRHLVSLVGYCIAENQRLLVYDYVPNNTLHYHLHAQGRPVLEWSIRVKVAAGAARGIAYLHEDCQPRIIHRDIKSSNILLDNSFEAQVADFGLARLALDAVTHVTTRVMGTFGYLAPEYASSGKLTERSDVFSFGVVLLELITSRKPVDASRPLGDESLVEWARPLLSQALETGEFGELVDPKLEKNFNEVEMFRMIEAAAACVRHSASRRPRMSQVVRVLDSLAEVDLTNGVQPGKSEMFNVANTSEIRLFQRMAFGNPDFSSDFSQSSWDSRRDVDLSGTRQM